MNGAARPAWRIAIRLLGWLALVALVVRLGSMALVVFEARGVEAPAAPIAQPALAPRLLARPSAGRFAIMGDPERGRGVFRDCLRSAKEQGCDFVVITGDLVKERVALAFRLFLVDLADCGYGDAYAVVRGNHDDAALYARFFGSSDWQARIGDTLFVGIDNGSGDCSAEQRDFAAKALAQKPAGGLSMAFLHKPVFPFTSKHEKSDRVMQEWHDVESNTSEEGDTPLARVFIAAKLDVAMVSHLHGYQDKTFDGVRQVISGGAGGNLQQEGAVFHYLVVDVAGASYGVRKVDVDSSRLAPRDLLENLGLKGIEEWDRERATAIALDLGWLAAILLCFVVSRLKPRAA